jgi:hypothetical protein
MVQKRLPNHILHRRTMKYLDSLGSSRRSSPELFRSAASEER